MIKSGFSKLEIKRYMGLAITMFLLLISIVIPVVSKYSYFDQNLELMDIPPVLKISKISPDYGVYIHRDLYPILFDVDGKVKGLLKQKAKYPKKGVYIFNNKELIFDFNGINDFKNIDYNKVKIIYDKKVLTKREEKIIWNKSNIFGTDQLGRDIFTRIFEGIKISLVIGIISSVVNLVIGVIYGGISGYIGGKIDVVMLNFLNIINSVPSILLVILLSLFVPQGIWSVIIIIGLVYWVSMARQVRAGVMILKRREFVLAEVVMGTPSYKIFFKHIVPNNKETILTTLIINVQNAIFTEAFLSFLGIGLPAPIASLGTLINDAMGNFRANSYQLIIPSIAIVLILVCLEKVSD